MNADQPPTAGPIGVSRIIANTGFRLTRTRATPEFQLWMRALRIGVGPPGEPPPTLAPPGEFPHTIKRGSSSNLRASDNRTPCACAR